jgi:ribosomal protein S6--L-glutamate ligase
MRKTTVILSFHPLYEADQHILCAGRDPGREELAAIKAARAVILPQGCRKSLYVMARQNCPHVFPNYDKRFEFPYKIGQARLFQHMGVPHPRTRCYSSVAAFQNANACALPAPDFPFPCVFKFDWGGEGDNVFLVKSPPDLEKLISRAVSYEKTGQYGFLLQEYIPTQGRSLRVVVIHQAFISYWRQQASQTQFYTNIKHGAVLEPDRDPLIQKNAVETATTFCSYSGINLAGFDFLFSASTLKQGRIEPLFLEINYFFGRKGLGGSDAYYKILQHEIDNWVKNIPQ